MKKTLLMFAALFLTFISLHAQNENFEKLSGGASKTWVCVSVSTSDFFTKEQKEYLSYTHVGAKWNFSTDREAWMELPFKETDTQMNPTILKATYGFSGKMMGFTYTEWSEPKAKKAWMNYNYVISYPRTGEMKAQAYQFDEASFEDVYMFTIHFEEEEE